MRNRYCAWLVLGEVLGGCGSDTTLVDIKDDTAVASGGEENVPDTGVPAMAEMRCTDGTCEAGITISYTFLYDCLSDGADWVSGTPAEITEDCVNESSGGTGTCLIVIDTINALPDEEYPLYCSCFPEEEKCGNAGPAAWDTSIGGYSDPTGCCHWSFPVEYGTGDSATDQLADTMFAAADAAAEGNPNAGLDCDTLFDVATWSCTDGTGPYFSANSACIPLDGGCDVSSIAAFPGIEYSFVVDTGASYVQLAVPGSTVQAALAGSVAVDTTGQDSFIYGTFWADDLTIYGVTFHDWFFVFDYPIDFNHPQPGDFTVSASEANHPGIVAKGLAFGDDVYSFRLDLAHGTTGHYSLANGTWSLDYVESQVGAGTVTVHLEGDVIEPSY